MALWRSGRPRTSQVVSALAVFSVCGAGCGELSARESFALRVAPVLEQYCSGTLSCHGVSTESEAQGEVVDWEKFFFRVDESQHIVDMDAAYEATKRAIDTASPAEFSTLLRKPLAVEYGGLPHWGKDNFNRPDHDGYRAIHRWITQEVGGGEEQPPLDELEQYFADEVQPTLVGIMCLNANCHGVDAAVPFRLEGGIDGRFSTAMTRHNYESCLSMLSLDGDPTQSRLLKKSLPLHQGGVIHKGGNASFMNDYADARLDPILNWACNERTARLGADCLQTDEAPLTGFVFVRGPIEAAGAFQLDSFVPGTELVLARVSGGALGVDEEVELSASWHDDPVDIRDPAVDHLGERVAFAMRRTIDEGHALYDVDLASGDLRQLTPHGGSLPGGGLHSDRDPTYDPNGHIWFVSTRTGNVADRGAALDADLYELDPASGEITRRTFTPHSERKPVFFAIGEEAGGEVAFTALRDLVPAQTRAHPFRFPPDLSSEYHQHFGITTPETLFYDMREMADGRYVVTIGELSGVWRAGRLGIVDRNFGPELNELAPVSESSLPFYADPLTRLDPAATSSGVTAGAYRDGVGLADGRLLVSYAEGPLDLEDPNAAPDFRIEVLTLTEAADGSGPFISTRRILADTPGIADRDPEPIYVRRPAHLAETQAWDPAAETGVLHHSGLGLIDGLLANLQPSGPKAALESIHGVRLVEAVDLTPAQRRPVLSGETLDGHVGATSTSLGTHGPARVLTELLVAGDGTFHVELPAGVPFRIQALDVDGMAIGVTHNRWYYVAPGQTLKQGISDKSGPYTTRCAGCHGARDGDPDHVFVPHDVLTMASVTQSRYEGGNPRHPIVPPLAGDETAFEVDFEADVQPILDRSCALAACHAGPDPAAGLSLESDPTQHFTLAYENLLANGVESGSGKRLVDEPNASARASFLIEKILGRELGAPADLSQPGVPHPPPQDGVPQPTETEIQTLIRWIDLGATFRGGSEAP